MIQPANIIYCLLSYIAKKLWINGIQWVPEFKLGPQQNSFLVRNIIDKIRGISTTSPNTKHILVPCRDRVKQLAHLLLRHAWPKRVRWDEVGTLGVELMPVNFKMPLLSDHSVSPTGLSYTITINLPIISRCNPLRYLFVGDDSEIEYLGRDIKP